MACVLKDKDGNVLSRAILRSDREFEISSESVELLKAAFDFRFKGKSYDFYKLFNFCRKALQKVSEFDEDYKALMICTLRDGGVLFEDFNQLTESLGSDVFDIEVLNSIYAVVIYSPEKVVFKPSELREYLNNVIVGFNPIVSGMHSQEMLKTINRQFMDKVLEAVCSSQFYEAELKANKIEYGCGSFSFVESNLKDYISALVGLKKSNQMVDEMVAYLLGKSAK